MDETCLRYVGFHADSELTVVSLVFVIFVATIGIIADADRVLRLLLL